jgi:hypothetical protein
LANTLAKEAATNADLIESYKKVPKSVVMSELSEIPYFMDYKTHFFLRKIASKIQVRLIIKMVKMLFF